MAARFLIHRVYGGTQVSATCRIQKVEESVTPRRGQTSSYSSFSSVAHGHKVHAFAAEIAVVISLPHACKCGCVENGIGHQFLTCPPDAPRSNELRQESESLIKCRSNLIYVQSRFIRTHQYYQTLGPLVLCITKTCAATQSFFARQPTNHPRPAQFRTMIYSCHATVLPVASDWCFREPPRCSAHGPLFGVAKTVFHSWAYESRSPSRLVPMYTAVDGYSDRILCFLRSVEPSCVCVGKTT